MREPLADREVLLRQLERIAVIEDLGFVGLGVALGGRIGTDSENAVPWPRAVEDGQTVDRTPGERPQRFGDRGCLDVGFPSFLLVGARCDVRTVSCSSAHQPYTGRKQPHEPGGQAGHPDEHER